MGTAQAQYKQTAYSGRAHSLCGRLTREALEDEVLAGSLMTKGPSSVVLTFWVIHL